MAEGPGTLGHRDRQIVDASLRDVSISASHRRYLAMDRFLMARPDAVHSHWFAAAACVTHPRRGLGTLDGVLGRLAFTPPQIRLLRFVHAGLFACNGRWFDHMRQGRVPPEFAGLAGRALDHAMVNAEQRLFTALSNAHRVHAPGAPTSRTREIDTILRSALVRSGLVAPALRDALRSARGAGCFDLACEAHRCDIGHRLVDLVRRQRGASAA